MPFARTAELVVTNDGAEPVPLEWEITHAPLAQPADQLLRFHAKWHGDLPPVREERAPDWTLLETSGAGRFVGTQLHVWNPCGGWWGEGDEKFFVDGEKFPSTFGTGTEDYFGYAWSSGKTFNQALHSQPVNENNRGHVSVSRWHCHEQPPLECLIMDRHEVDLVRRMNAVPLVEDGAVVGHVGRAEHPEVPPWSRRHRPREISDGGRNRAEHDDPGAG